MTRTKALVLGLFAVYWGFVVVLLVAARNVYDGLLPQEVTQLGGQRSAEIGTLLVVTASLLCYLSASSAVGAGPSG